MIAINKEAREKIVEIYKDTKVISLFTGVARNTTKII